MQLVGARAPARRHVDTCSQSPSPPPSVSSLSGALITHSGWRWFFSGSEGRRYQTLGRKGRVLTSSPGVGGGSLGPSSPSSVPSLTPASLSPSSPPLLHHPRSRLHSLSIIPRVVCHRVQRSPSLRSSDAGVAGRARRRRSAPCTQQQLRLSRPSSSLVHTCSREMKPATSALSRCVLHKATVAPCY